MALSDNKVLQSAAHYRNVQAQVGNRLTGTVAENKKVFDDYPELIKDCYNNLIDDLESTTANDSGASAIGIEAITGVSGTDIQGALEDLKTQIDSTASTASINLLAHTGRTDNPHSVTSTQVAYSGTGMVATTVKGAVDELKTITDGKLSTSTAASTYETIVAANALIKNVTLNSTTGVLTFTKQDNSTFTIDTALEEIPTTMRFFENPVGSGTYYLGIYDKNDRLISSVNVSTLFNPIEVADTSTIDMTQTTSQQTGVKTISADIKNGSISASMLDSTLAGRITTLETEIADAITNKADTGRIAITLSTDANGRTLSADIVAHSIGETQIDSQYMTDILAAKSAAELAETNAGTSATNAENYKTQAGTSATNASTSAGTASSNALISEGYAVGKQNGVDVESGTYYQNNAKYYKEQSSIYSSLATTKATEASTSATSSQSWAVGGTGTRSGEDTNNAKYWCEQAGQIAGGVFVTSVNNVSPAGGVSGPITLDADHIDSSTTTNKFTNAAEKAVWSAKQDALPSQTSQSGKFLTTDGSSMSWASVDALPSQTGQAGKFLTTNGSVASWANATIAIEFLGSDE